MNRNHRPLLKDFRNQHESLTRYLQRFALRHQKRDLLSKTYVAIDRVENAERIAGYFSLAATSVTRESVRPIKGLERLPRFPLPSVLLTRMAIDERVQGQGLGRYLLEEALARTLELAQTGILGIRLFVTDAIDESAARFYEKFGFLRLGDRYPCRMVLDLRGLIEP